MTDIQVIEGQRTVVTPTGSGLPQKLTDLLVQLTFVTYRDDFPLAGARPACETLREHRFRRFRKGRWFARGGIRRGEVLDLVLDMCRDCGCVKVVDVSLDWLPGLRVGASGMSRRSMILDWYSGSRPGGRVYL